MNEQDLEIYGEIRSGSAAGFITMPRGLISVSGREAVQFLDGMISNDVKTLKEGSDMLAAFPNAQGRLLAVVRVLKDGEKFIIATEAATREKVYENLHRFTFAGDFFVDDLSDEFVYFELIGKKAYPFPHGFQTEGHPTWVFSQAKGPAAVFVSTEAAEAYRTRLIESGSREVTKELYEALRIESGIPLFGVDMDESTIVPELGLEGMISYTKGCYIGQEIIARIHFRGHVAKQLAGLIFADQERVGKREEPHSLVGAELTSADGRNAGRVTSVTYSPKLEREVALAFVRYDYLAPGTELAVDGRPVRVARLPFIE